MNPAPPTLPNPYRTPMRVALAIAALVVAIGLCFLVPGRNWFNNADVVGLICLLLSLGPLVGFVLLWDFTRRLDAQRERIEQGRYLARWQYSPAQWQQFQPADDERARQAMGGDIMVLVQLGAAAMLGGGGLFVLSHARDFKPADGWIVLFVSVGVALLFGGFVLTRYLLFARQRARMAAYAAAPPESVIGEDFAYANGEFIVWQSIGNRNHLVDIGIVSGPPMMIELAIRWDTNLTRNRILVPAGHEAEAAKLVEAIRQGPKVA